MTSSLLQALIAHFDSVFEGPNGDYTAVLETLADVSAAQAAWSPAPGCNSIGQITDHLTASKKWQIDMLEKGQADPPVWTEPNGDEKAWQLSIVQLKAAHVQLKAALARLTDTELLSVPTPEEKQTQLELLLSIAAHEAYHAGQIDYLKGLQTRT
ncbi:MAG TPA: DinB family protein [Longilinea sp.]|nr:DinB family protein [Longilinea sp.]